VWTLLTAKPAQTNTTVPMVYLAAALPIAVLGLSARLKRLMGATSSSLPASLGLMVAGVLIR